MSEGKESSERTQADSSYGKPKYKSKVSGLYAKAKQRILNKLGKRTVLTRYPKADGMNKRYLAWSSSYIYIYMPIFLLGFEILTELRIK
jgi:hypothetical protein